MSSLKISRQKFSVGTTGPATDPSSGPYALAMSKFARTLAGLLKLTSLADIPDGLGLLAARNDLRWAEFYDLVPGASRSIAQLQEEFRAVSRDQQDRLEEHVAELLREISPEQIAGAALQSAETAFLFLCERDEEARLLLELDEDSAAYLNRVLTLVAESLHGWTISTAADSRVTNAGLARILELLATRDEPSVALRAGVAAPEADPGALVSAARVVALAHRELTRARASATISRDRQVDDLIGLAAAGKPTAVLAPGGLGKSTVLAQLAERVAAMDDLHQIVVVANCSDIPTGTPFATADDADRALGFAAFGPELAVSLAEGLETLRSRFDTVWVIIDTLDLVVDETTAHALESALRSLADDAKVVLACRMEEWEAFFGASARLQVNVHTLRYLNPEEILQWARHYLGALKQTPANCVSMLESIERNNESSTFNVVLQTPLRLDMACQIYGAVGRIPSDLTVTELYERYWSEKLARDRRGHQSAEADARTRSATLLARELWTSSTAGLREFAPVRAIGGASAVRMLVSEGIATQVGDRVGFFHQTFLEFAVARVLAYEGTPQDLKTLNESLVHRRPGYWAIASHIAQLKVDAARQTDLKDAVPIDSVEGMRLHLLWCIKQDDDRGLGVLLNSQDPHQRDLILANVRELKHSRARCVPLVVAFANAAFANASRNHVHHVGDVLTDLVRHSGDGSTVSRILTTVTTQNESLSAANRSSIVSAMIASVIPALSPEVFAEQVVPLYTSLPPASQGALVRAVIARTDLSPAHLASVATLAWHLPVPAGFVPDFVDLVRSLDEDDARSIGLDMANPSFLLRAANDHDRWDAVLVRLAGNLAIRPENLRGVVSVALSDEAGADRDRFTNALLFAFDADPDAVLEDAIGRRIVSPGPARTLAALATHASRGLPSLRRRQLLEAVRKCTNLEPRICWPTVFTLSLTETRSENTDLNAAWQGLSDWLGHDEDHVAEHNRVIEMVVRTVIDATQVPQLSAQESQIRAITGHHTVDRRKRELEARLDGSLSPQSVAARLRLEKLLRDRPRENAVTAAAREIARRVSEEPRAPYVDWCFTLLGTKDVTVVSLVAEALAPLGTTLAISPSARELVIKRLSRSNELGENSRVARPLIALLEGSGVILGPSEREELEASFLRRLARLGEADSSLQDPVHSDRAGVYLNLLYVNGRLVLPGLEASGAAKVLSRLLKIDVATVSGQAKKSLAHFLQGSLFADPAIAPILEQQCWDTSPPAVKEAIVKAFVAFEFRTDGRRSQALAARTDCPPSAAASVHRAFQSL